jgi:hypothetical protein
LKISKLTYERSLEKFFSLLISHLPIPGRDMELFMIYKISPHPSLSKRGKESENFAKEGKRKGRNNPLGYAKSHKNWSI